MASKAIGGWRFDVSSIAAPFPWLTASRLPELLLYQPIGRQDTPGEPLPTHIRTPDGKEYSLGDEALLKEIATRHGAELELMQLSHGIFDDACVSAIALGTMEASLERRATTSIFVVFGRIS